MVYEPVLRRGDFVQAKNASGSRKDTEALIFSADNGSTVILSFGFSPLNENPPEPISGFHEEWLLDDLDLTTIKRAAKTAYVPVLRTSDFVRVKETSDSRPGMDALVFSDDDGSVVAISFGYDRHNKPQRTAWTGNLEEWSLSELDLASIARRTSLAEIEASLA